MATPGAGEERTEHAPAAEWAGHAVAAERTGSDAAAQRASSESAAARTVPAAAAERNGPPKAAENPAGPDAPRHPATHASPTATPAPRRLHILSATGTATIQDAGRPGFLALGLSQGGAADPVALAEGAALLGQPPDLAAIELMSAALTLRADQPTRIALTGAPMRASLEADEARSLDWNASHLLPPGARLTISPGPGGGFGYLHVGGGLDTPPIMGARGAHLAGGIGRALAAGDALPLGTDRGRGTDLTLDPTPRFAGGVLRAVDSLQTRLFGADQIARLQQTLFRRDTHGNRMGARLDLDGAQGFGTETSLSILSEIVRPGDIQITGDGTPFVLLGECQTTGGYPRIATILPCDLPLVAQAAPGSPLTIRLIGRAEAIAALRAAARDLADLPRRVRPRRPDAETLAARIALGLTGGVVDATNPDHIAHALLPAREEGAAP